MAGNTLKGYEDCRTTKVRQSFLLSVRRRVIIFPIFPQTQLILGMGNQTLLQKSQKQRLFDFVFKFRIPVFMDGFVLHG